MEQSDDVDDRALVVRTLAGQRDAYAALVRRYQGGVLAFAYRLSHRTRL
jgi:hypothetical protein